MPDRALSRDALLAREAVVRRLGLHVEDGRMEELRAVVEARARALGHSGVAAYLAGLDGAGAEDEVAALARSLTVNETYFFRNPDSLRAYAAILAGLLAGEDGKQVRVLSAGCASGEEPYSLAMAAAEALGQGACEGIDVLGLDVVAELVERGRRGEYGAWSLRATPPELIGRYFAQASADSYRLASRTVRAMVSFEVVNLAEDDWVRPLEGRFDVVFCRNVLMYFSPRSAAALVERLRRVLAPGGCLFVGHAENLRGLSDEFTLRNRHGAFFYETKGASTPGQKQVPAPGYDVPNPQPGAAPVRGAPFAAAPAAAPDAPGSTAPAPRPASATWEVGVALDALRRERFDDALTVLSDVVEARGGLGGADPEVLLLLALVQVNSGEIAAAAAVCAELLARDELSAGAHYVAALCAEQRGELTQASEHARVACYLDPTFAMPRVHLGLLARRRNDAVTARYELRHALGLLARDDASRILLFGGGFSRSALLSLCTAELRAAGGEP